MSSRRWKVKVALIAVGLTIVAAEALCLPSLTLWFAKRKAWQEIEGIADHSPAALYCVPAPGLHKVPTLSDAADRVDRTIDGYTLSLPANTYQAGEEDPNLLAGAKLSVGFRGVSTRTPNFREEFAPPSAAVRRYFARTDPYQLLQDAFAATPAGIEAARDHDQLQKHLYLMLLRSAVQPPGADKQWIQFEAGGRKGFLAGDTTCKPMDVAVYIPEAGQFASISLWPEPGATMDDVWTCLGQLAIEKRPVE